MYSKMKEKSIELFFKKGYAATSVRDITNSLNITPAALYAHFSSKADLFLQVLEDGWDDVAKGLEEVIEGCNNNLLENPLYDIYKYYLNFYMNESSRTIFLIRSVMFPPDELRDKVFNILESKTNELNKKIEEILLKLIRENIIKDLPTKEHLSIFYRLINSFIFEITALNRKIKIVEMDHQWERYWSSIAK
ncbi:TetR/AcrR family transcriptional regulator [Clostridium sp.]|uniref:TetR/AcrR family transcriptional regulator n=1 Tax=Clostridium sp. TaxID=1506 RepID=UPI003217DC38